MRTGKKNCMQDVDNNDVQIRNHSIEIVNSFNVYEGIQGVQKKRSGPHSPHTH